MVPLGTIFVYSLWQRDVPIREAVTTAVAGIVTLIPEGLVLLLSLTFAAAALQLARRGALAQQLNATESLAAVDVLCLDKTGTLTHPGLRVVAIEPESIAEPLGRFAASSPAQNATLRAIADAVPAEAAAVEDYEPFSSDRRYSALTIEGQRWRLGAPELFDLDALGDRAAAERVRAGACSRSGTAARPRGSSSSPRSCAATRARPSSSSDRRASSCA